MSRLLPPDIDFEHVSQYNDHGAALVELLRTRPISPQHRPFILGVFAVYATLVSMNYMTADNISWPPHSDFTAEEWVNSGYSQEVCEILGVLPYPLKSLRNWDIAPEAPAISYLGRGRMEVRDTTFNEVFDVRPEHLRLTDGGGNGNNYIYDTGNATMYIQNMMTVGGQDYTTAPFHPATLIMENWIQNLHDLIYIPWPCEECGIIQVQPGPKEYFYETGTQNPVTLSSLQSWANETNWSAGLTYREDQRRVWLNFVRAIRQVYVKHGWPSQEFNGSACLEDLQRFYESNEEFDEKVRLANPYHWDSTEPSEAEIGPRREREEFLEEAAGPLAIRRDQ